MQISPAQTTRRRFIVSAWKDSAFISSAEDNEDAHLRRQIIGRGVRVAITNGKLDFGPWAQVFCGELFGTGALGEIIGA